MNTFLCGVGSVLRHGTALRRGTLAAACVVLLALQGSRAGGQDRHLAPAPRNVVTITPGESLDQIVAKAARVAPTPRQLAWQEMEFIAFVHFGTNTFSDREWGLGTENPADFNPTALDARQWARVVKEAGMKMIIVTAKHHDGLCLWPSRFTDHSVRRSPWKNGTGDVVGEVAAACREFGLKFGVYLSPWDRHEPTYGTDRYNEHFRNQLRELLTGYGEVSEVWFDGANGEGPNGKRQEYDWQSYYRLIRELQPGAVIAVMGPDVRWVGTESGYGRETEWSVVPDAARNLEAIAAGSQQNPGDGAFVPGDLMADDLGSREKIKNARALAWYPSEVDVSIRPGWFYHADQDDRVKTPQKLVDIYFSSVGRNSVLLLNLPPDKRGLIHENDVASLKGMKAILDRTFARDLVAGATAASTSASPGHPPSLAVDGDARTYWTTAEGVPSATIDVTLPSERSFDRALLREYIREGQRVERFHVDAWDGSAWRRLADGTTIGYKRLLRFPAVTASKVRLVIDESRLNPTISTFGLYKGPARVTIQPDGGGFEDSLAVRLDPDVRGAVIHYTLDGTTPNVRSPRYDGPIIIRRSGTLRATPVLEGEEGLEYSEARFTKRFEVKQVTFGTPYSPRYAGHGDTTVADGRRAAAAFDDGQWLGFESDDMVATLDLGRVRPIASVTAGFLQQQGSWIFLPARVACSVSADGTTWTRLPDKTFPESRSAEVTVSDCAFTAGGLAGRYVRLEAKNVGTCPPWHDGAGGKAWLFVDEIIVE